jgi:hypothetical protein
VAGELSKKLKNDLVLVSKIPWIESTVVPERLASRSTSSRHKFMTEDLPDPHLP